MMKRLCIAFVTLMMVAAGGCGPDEARNNDFDVEEDAGYDADQDDGGETEEDTGDREEDTGGGGEDDEAADGAACDSAADCAGDQCFTEQQQFPDGYCSTTGCTSDDDCVSGEDHEATCVQSGQGNFCMRTCTTPDDCRDGYTCQAVGEGEDLCIPGEAPDPNLDEEAIDDHPFEITCGLEAEDGELDIDFEVDEETSAYMITPLALDGISVTPTAIELPDGDQISFSGDNDFQTVNSQMFGYLNPIVTPAIADFEDQLQSGEHTLKLDTASEDVCYYQFEESEPGTTVDLNVYLVGVPGIDADSASDNEDMQVVLDGFEEIYEQADVEIGEIEFRDIEGDDREAYRVVRSEEELSELVALSERPEGGEDAALSANVFFVESMQLDSGFGGVQSGAIGISLGLPGPAGLHGTSSSGVVFTSEYMGEEEAESSLGDTVDGNDLTGIVLAHELGHYLGLFHTSEQFGQGYDPIDDTPECESGFPTQCPDLGNLMFPMAGADHTEVTEGQSHVIQANPLTKE
ncbi:MAG: hypothetical protein ACOCV2_10585 [Persicimonas sp.]